MDKINLSDECNTKKYVNLSASLTCSCRDLDSSDEYPSFKILDGFLDIFIRFNSDAIILRAYKNHASQYPDILFKTEYMKWDIKEDWDWYEIPYECSKNEKIINKLIKSSYRIAFNQNKKYNQFFQKIIKQEFNEKDILDLILKFKNADKYKETLKVLNKKSILLLEKPYEAVDLGDSKLGGEMHASSSFVWPQFDGNPLTFLGQINLSLINNQNFPQEGFLYFFAMITNDEDAYYHYFDIMNETGATKVIYQQYSLQELEIIKNDYFQFKEVKLKPYSTDSYPQEIEEPILNQFKKIEKQKINDIADIYYEILDYKLQVKNHHNLLGYYRPIQCFSEDARDKKYITLFQMSSSEYTNLDWGDGGMLYIYIAQEDLLNLNFDNIIVDSHCG